MKRINETIDKKVNSLTVNSYKKDSNTVNSSTVNCNAFKNEIEEAIQRHGIKNEGLAKFIAELLDDSNSLKWYQLLLNENSPDVLLEIAHYVKDKDRQGMIKTTKAIYFQAILRRRKIRTKFKEKP